MQRTLLIISIATLLCMTGLAASAAADGVHLTDLAVPFVENQSQQPDAVKFHTDTFNVTTCVTEQNATYSVEAGAYDVQLTVNNADGDATVRQTRYISSSTGPKRLATVQSGTVSGDLYVGAYGGFNSGTMYTTNTFNQTFTLPAYTDVQWARLYTVVYAAGTDNRTGSATVKFDGDGDGTYDTLGIETLATAGDNTANVYPVNDHVNRQYSDYLLWYDVTGLIDSQNPKAEVVSTPVASNFDGRIKELVLVVAYDDGDDDEVHYWVNDGHDYQASGADEVTSTFATRGLPAGWTDATLRNVMLSSRDALYTFNGAPCTGADSTIYFGTNTWDVSNDLTAGSDSSFTYAPNGGSYKTTLATLAVKYSAGGDTPVAPVADFTANVTAGEAPLAVQFTDHSENAPTFWVWDFGDNETSNEQNPTHIYTAPGTYMVTLTVTNPAGSDTETKTSYITASGSLPAQVDLAIAGTVNPVPGAAVFAREPNPVRITNVENNGQDTATNIVVALYVSDVADGTVAVNTTTIESLAGGAQITVTLTDPTIRDLEGDTVTYTAVVDPDNLIAETDETNNDRSSPVKDVRYNGYKGKGIYWGGGSNITTKQTFDIQGDIVSLTQPQSAYRAVGWTDRTETWTAGDLTVPAGAAIKKVLLYVSYNWDTTQGSVPNIVATFNGNPIALGTPYLDKSNFGFYADHKYGLYPAVDVTNLFVQNGDNTLVMTAGADNRNVLYPSTLVVVYSDPSMTRKQIFLNEECDELGYSESSYGTTMEEATAYAPFTNMTIDAENVENATLYSFVGSAGPDEGNLLFNGVMAATNAWQGTASAASAQAFDVTGLLGATENVAGIQATDSGGMCALQQILVVEYAETADQADLMVQAITPNADEIFANEPNNITIRVANSGTAAAGQFTVRITVNETAFDLMIPGLAAGANTTLEITDPAIRAFGESVAILALADTDNSISESNETNNALSIEKTVVYNGYKGKRWTDGNDMTTQAAFDGRYGVIYSAGNTSYAAASWTEKTYGWSAEDLPIPEGATIASARLYQPYSYNKMESGPAFTMAFNGQIVTPIATYSDRKSFGGYDYPYGLYVYDVTASFAAGGNSITLTPEADNAYALFGGYLVVVYEDPSTTVKSIRINDEFDMVYTYTSYAVTSDEATVYAPFSDVNATGVSNATAIAILASAGDSNKSKFYFNDNKYAGFWTDYQGTPQIGFSAYDVTAALQAGENLARMQSYDDAKGDNMYAMNAILVIEYADPGLPDLTVSTLAPNNGEVFSASENAYTIKITNIGTDAVSAFDVEFNASGVTGTVAVDGLAAGANTTVTWTDETIRNAGDVVTVTVTADADGVIAESNKENNLLAIEKIVVRNGYRGTRWTGGADITTATTYDVRGDLFWSAGDGAYLSAGTNWVDYSVHWTVGDLPVPANATIAVARLYVPYTYDKGPVFPESVTLTFNGDPVESVAFYEDEKMWGTSYPYGMTVYDVTNLFSPEGNTALLANTFPGGGNVSIRGMLLTVVYDDGTTAPHTIIMNEGFDLLYGGEAQGTTPEQATAYAPFAGVDTEDAVSATLITVAPGAGPVEGDLLFNDETWTDVWNYAGTSQIGVNERDVTSFLLPGENLVGFRSDGDWMEAAAAFLVVGYVPEPAGNIPVADFSADVTNGSAPLTVTFTDASTGNATAWAWDFGDGMASAEQNPIHTYLTAGTYTVSLRVTNEDGSNSTAKPDYIAVTLLQGEQSKDLPLDIPGCTMTPGSGGSTQVSINTSENGARVTGNTVTIQQADYTVVIETEDTPTVENSTIIGTIATIRLDTQPVITKLDAIEVVSVSVSANLTHLPTGARLTTTVSQEISPDAQSAFQIAAGTGGLNLGDVAYTLNIVRTNLENTQDIADATIRMTVSPAWVEAHGGVDAIRIIRSAEDGTKEVLVTRLVGTDVGGNMIFEAVSPNGLSVFGLAAVSEVAQPTQSSPSRSSGGGSSSTAVDAASHLKPGDRVTLTMDGTAVSAVTLTATREVNDVMVTMAKGSLPQAAEPPANTIYQFVRATLYKATEDDLSNIRVRFVVPNTWLNEHGYTAGQILLFRYAEDTWQEAPVEVLGEESGNTVFAATPGGFGLFAITATEQVPDVAGSVTLQTTTTGTAAGAEAAGTTAEPTGTIPATPQTPLPVWTALLALAVLLLVRRGP